MRQITDIVIHCAATPNFKDIKASAIDAMHCIRGFKRTRDAISAFNPGLKYIGYHYVIEVDGNIAFGRAPDEIGAHVQGNNAKSLGICMIGTDQFTPAQWASLIRLLITLATNLYGAPARTIQNALSIFKLLDVSVKGHRDYSPDLNGDGQITRNEWLKICPGFDVATWLKGLA
jgi:N-acetylmuramoyl-L-alanine amidase